MSFQRNRLTDSLLAELITEAQELLGQGQVANYIPALAQVNPQQIGIAVCFNDGEVVAAGDAQQPFSIQSISKLFTLVQAINLYQDELWQGIGREPSGQRFNSMVQLETDRGVPRNPFINAGALAICDRLAARQSAPTFQLIESLRKLAANPQIHCNQRVARSELAHGARNAAMAYLMKAFDNFANPVDTVLSNYCHHCAIEMSCIDLSRATSFLANKGRALDGTHILSPDQTTRVNALMATCGLYDASGEFAYEVGLPGKSGVGGGIIAIYPGHFSVCVWSPELNPVGNSLIGTWLLESLTERLGISIY
ncbi:MAG: glutaminase B [Gammaproteobacteria bacterium]|nr:glutaminase B [Gammaproteobacteria bacterium]NVK87679.1 glutaminase B [Gammaproteobacteria bacterium]